MREKKLKIRIEDAETGKVTELSSNCIAVITADNAKDADGDNGKDVQILTIGHCTKAEEFALAEGLACAEKKMRERVLNYLGIPLEDQLKDFKPEVDA